MIIPLCPLCNLASFVPPRLRHLVASRMSPCAIYCATEVGPQPTNFSLLWTEERRYIEIDRSGECHIMELESVVVGLRCVSSPHSYPVPHRNYPSLCTYVQPMGVTLSEAVANQCGSGKVRFSGPPAALRHVSEVNPVSTYIPPHDITKLCSQYRSI